jgi:catechol 2,3-dioxygenase-like lactoylglutathione lyase family enzyme
MASINGIAHLQLTVSNMETSIPFYRTLLTSLEMEVLIDSEEYFYCIGGRTGIAIAPSKTTASANAFSQGQCGLHHLCLRAKSAVDVDEIYNTALNLGAVIIRAPQEDDWAPGYYSVLFEDPDGIRIEANYVPGKGHLKK